MDKCAFTALKVCLLLHQIPERFLQNIRLDSFLMFNLKFMVTLTRKHQKANKTQSLIAEAVLNPFAKILNFKKLQVWYSDEIKMKKKNVENQPDQIIKWIKEEIQNSWQTILEMLRTGSCGKSNGPLSLPLYFVVNTMFYISPWFPWALLPRLPHRDGLCSGGFRCGSDLSWESWLHRERGRPWEEVAFVCLCAHGKKHAATPDLKRKSDFKNM